LGKIGNKSFESAAQHFFYRRRRFLFIAREVLLQERADSTPSAHERARTASQMNGC
jgi:hypothetical protein